MADHGRRATEYDGSRDVDPVAEATVQAAAGASTDTSGDASYNDDLTDGRSPDPDLAQGESD